MPAKPESRGAKVRLRSLVEYLDGYLDTATHPDYPGALNGLQVESRGTDAGESEVKRVAAAVDASAESISSAVELGADLLIVHHGIFWGGPKPVKGPHGRRIRLLLESGLSLYSSHLPLDSHREVGNCILLTKRLGIEPRGRLGSYKERAIGWWGQLPEPVPVGDLCRHVGEAVGGPVRHVHGGPKLVDRIGVLTGAGGSVLEEACNLGLDLLVTGETGHSSYFDATEGGLHLLLGGHYNTETLGVKALAAHIEQRFGVPWGFIHQPTGF